MNNDIPEINELIQQFSKLPGLGPKSAKRIILKLINNKDNMVNPLAKSLAQVYKKVVRCIDCGNLKKQSAEELSKVTGGLNLPLDFKLPF